MRQKIESTKYYQSLSNSQKIIYGTRKCMIEIERHFGICKRLGVEKWKKDFKPNKVQLEVVLELISYNEKN